MKVHVFMQEIHIEIFFRRVICLNRENGFNALREATLSQHYISAAHTAD